MATWNAFAESAPELAELGLKLLNQYGAAFLATVRKDGSPRLHPVVPIVTEGRLFVFCGGPKVYDLRRDGRYNLHALIGRDDTEFLVAGRALYVNDDRTIRAAVARAAPYKVPVDPSDLTHQLFHFNIERAHVTVWYHPGQPDTRPTHTDWSAHD
jgi:Pyridoxamine 5'-phosphate oxidase